MTREQILLETYELEQGSLTGFSTNLSCFTPKEDCRHEYTKTADKIVILREWCNELNVKAHHTNGHWLELNPDSTMTRRKIISYLRDEAYLMTIKDLYRAVENVMPSHCARVLPVAETPEEYAVAAQRFYILDEWLKEFPAEET
jgi:hypothetical protein